MRAFTFVLLGVLAGTAGAQTTDSNSATSTTGSISGKVMDKKSGEGLTNVGIHVNGQTIGVMSGVGGRFYLKSAPTGTLTINVRRIGYTPKTITGVSVRRGAVTELDVSLEPAVFQLNTQVVSASAERGTVNAALDKQRTATAIVSSVTAEQITKSPDRDAAQAVQRVSGVTVQGGKYVFVRGLGERYTTTSLNGTRLPSPEPEKKTVPLDLFPSALLQQVTTSKTFTPDQPGDFSGAAVNLETRDFPLKAIASYSISAGYNTAATGRSVLTAPHVGSEWLAMAGSDRNVPQEVLDGGSLRGLTRAQSNAIVRSFRNVWLPTRENGAPNSSLGVTTGGKGELFGNTLGYIASGTYALTQDVRVDEVRARAVATSATEQRAVNLTTGTTGREGATLGGILNVSTLFGSRNKIALNNMYTRSSDNEAHADSGYLELGTEANTRRSTLTFVERAVRSNQLVGEHALSDKQNFDWTVSNSSVTRREPDRADLVYVQQAVNGQPGPFALDGGTDDGAKRSFKDLKEDVWTAGGNYKVSFGNAEQLKSFKFGGQYRYTKRDVISRTYSIYANLTPQQASQSPEQIFQTYSADTSNVFTPINNSAAGSYNAEEVVGAGYGLLDIPLGSRIKIVGGARVESWGLNLLTEKLFADDANIAAPRSTDVLPSVAINFKPSDWQNFRVSYSRTLSRPEYREVSPLLSREVIGEVSTIGNPNLHRALIDNYDFRWESYPHDGELLSVAFFGKRFHNPIERVEIATSGAVNYSFVNANSASNYGVEIEARKGLGFLGDAFAPFGVFANTTLMKSSITPGNSDISALTNAERPMVGQAPYVVNAGVSWQGSGGKTSATLLFNTVGDRITAAASKPLPDTYELARNVLDFSMQFPVGRRLGAKFNARNLLDSPYVEEQGSVTRVRYTTGRVFSLGFTWSQ